MKYRLFSPVFRREENIFFCPLTSGRLKNEPKNAGGIDFGL
jgi:hypothetical protein